MYEVIDNVLDDKDFNEIKSFLISPHFPWNFCSIVSSSSEVHDDTLKLPENASYYFTHVFWEKFEREPECQIFAKLLDRMDCKAIIRIKANCYPSTHTIIHHNNHQDYPFPHKGAIFYLNTNNGLTILDDTHEIKSV